MQEKSFFCRIRWVGVGSDAVSGHLLPGPVCVLYSYFDSTLDAFQLDCDIIGVLTVIRCFFQANVIHLVRQTDTHTHVKHTWTHTQLLVFVPPSVDIAVFLITNFKSDLTGFQMMLLKTASHHRFLSNLIRTEIEVHINILHGDKWIYKDIAPPCAHNVKFQTP